MLPLAGTNGYSLVGSNFDIAVSADTTQSGFDSLAFGLTQLAEGVLSQGTIKTFYKRSQTPATIFKVHVDVQIAAVVPT